MFALEDSQMKMLAKMALPEKTQSKWQSLLENALMVAAAASLTYVTEHLSSMDFGTWTPWIVAGSSMILNFVKKLVEGNGTNPIPIPVPTPVPVPTPIPVPTPVPVPTPIPSDEGTDFPLI